MSAVDRFIRWATRAWEELLERAQLREILTHPVPRYSNLNPLWWIGDIAVVCFVILALTGMVLALFYRPGVETVTITLPSGEEIRATRSFESVYNIYYHVPFGFLLREIHLWTAYIMVMATLMHFTAKLIMGSYKGRGKGLMWVIGVILGFLVINQTVLGYVLPLQTEGVLALQIGLNIFRYMDLMGIPLGSLIIWFMGSSFVTTEVISKVFILHIIIVPALILVLLALKINILLYAGPSRPPHGSALEAQVVKLWDIKEPFYPHRVALTLGQVFLQLGFILLLVSVFPIPLVNPRLGYEPWTVGEPITGEVRAPWVVSWYYYLVKAVDPIIGVWAPIVMVVFALLIPLLDRGSSLDINRRWVWVLVAAIYFVILGLGSVLGYLIETPHYLIPPRRITISPDQLTPVG